MARGHTLTLVKTSGPKTHQLQVRVSASQKRAIQDEARRAGMSMSDWVLSRLVQPAQERFQKLLAALASTDQPSYAFAELLDLLDTLGAHELERAVAAPPGIALDAYWSNYVAATVEHAAARKGVPPPAWTAEVRPLDEPAFGSRLESLRLHLLTHSPPAFARRNIFIDSSVGSRV